MRHQGDYLKELIKIRGITQENFAKSINISRPTLIRYLNRERIDFKNSQFQKILSALNLTEKERLELLAIPKKSNLFDIGAINNDQETPIVEISPGRYRMEVELVPIYAQAGYLTEYMDTEYIENLPKHYITVDRFVRGKYRAFEAAGESMDNGDVHEAIPHGTIITGREVARHHWTSKLHNHNWPNWIFVHKTEGAVVKQIAKHDVENGVVTLRSLNPDKELYPDFDVHLDDVLQIYNVVKRELR